MIGLLFLPICLAQIYPFEKWDSFSIDNQSYRAFSNQRVYNQILDKLLNSTIYDGRLRPNATSANPAMVYVRITLTDVTNLNEKNFALTSDFVIEQVWMDLRLRFTGMIPTRNDTYIVVRDKWVERIWIPDIYFENGRNGFRQAITRKNQEMRVYPNGTVLYSIRLTMTLRCDMHLSRYPLDTQHCYVNLSSFSYAERDLVFKWAGYDAVNILDVSLPAFDVQNEYFLSACSSHRLHAAAGIYTCISAKLYFRRQFQYHIMQTYLPTFLLVVASWMSFWIDPTAVPARVGLSVTLLLSTLTLGNGIRQSLPPVSEVKAIDVWMFTCIFYVFCALLEFSVMNYAHTKLKRGEKLCSGLGRLCRCCNRKKAAKAVMIEAGESSPSSDEGKDRVKVISPPPKPAPADHMPIIYDVDRISQILFPSTFVLFNIIYWPMYAHGE